MQMYYFDRRTGRTALYDPFAKGPAAVRGLQDLHDALAAAITGRTAGGVVSADTLKALYRSVAPVYRAVSIRSKALAGVPFTLRRAADVDAVVFDSDDAAAMPPGAEALDDLRRLLRLTEAALVTIGKARIHKERLVDGGPVTSLRWYDPCSVTYDPKRDLDDVTGEIVRYRRRVAGQAEDVVIPAEFILAVDYPDPFTEIGAGTSPLRAALEAGKLLQAFTSFASEHIEGGLTKNFAFFFRDPSGQGRTMGEAEQTRAKRKLFDWLRTKGTPSRAEDIPIWGEGADVKEWGEGLGNIANDALTREAWIQIGAALEVPESLMTSSAANYATAQSDAARLYTEVVFPDCDLIEDALNTQLLDEAGLVMRFEKSRVDAIQYMQLQQAQGLQLLAGGLPIITREEARDNLAGLQLRQEEPASLEAAPAPNGLPEGI